MAKNVNGPRRRLTRREQQDLDLEIGFLEGLVRRDPTYVEALQILGDNYTRRGRYTEGLKVDERLSRLRPDDSVVYYNLACSYSLTSQIESAADAWLRRSTWDTATSRRWTKTPIWTNLRQCAEYQTHPRQNPRASVQGAVAPEDLGARLGTIV